MVYSIVINNHQNKVDTALSTGQYFATIHVSEAISMFRRNARLIFVLALIWIVGVIVYVYRDRGGGEGNDAGNKSVNKGLILKNFVPGGMYLIGSTFH